jgi:hypothetical protein
MTTTNNTTDPAAAVTAGGRPAPIQIRFQREWCQPSRWTFTLWPIAQLLKEEMSLGQRWIDPFAGMNSPAQVTNDFNSKMPTKYHLDAKEFLELIFRVKGPESFHGAIYDPPYNKAQYRECYHEAGLPIDPKFEDTKYNSEIKALLAKLVKHGGKAICCGWNSMNLYQENGFWIVRQLNVAHGKVHNDTIVTVGIKFTPEEIQAMNKAHKQQEDLQRRLGEGQQQLVL